MDFKEKLRSVVNDNVLTDGEKHTELCFLLSKMAYEHNIPLTYDSKYKENNKTIIDVFECISEEIDKLNNS
ncbi:hypothetical protein ABD91_20605 [Lysinibacillus sphaericus]|uniref:hypothetical protein n=1 Tax=Lysinibacillus sphaericus TaxID=1421 RepID=UPI0018CCE64B|nr:hypothetical protein [Lysinibacillus sphaericus]MBG9693145.1 hypothetical protein [Lysinibacillus sphaericus]